MLLNLMNFNFAKITKCPLVFRQIIIVDLCRIIYNQKKKRRRRRNSKLLSLHFYLQWCTQCGKSFCIGAEARNPSLVWKTKTTKEKMESFHFVNWDQSYSFIPIFILLACIITIMSNNLLKKEKNSNLLSLHFYLRWCTQYGNSFYFGRWHKESFSCLEHKISQRKNEMVSPC